MNCDWSLVGSFQLNVTPRICSMLFSGSIMRAILVFRFSSEVQDVPLVPLPMVQVLPELPFIVTSPVLAMEKRVVVAYAAVEEEMTNTVLLVSVPS